MKRSKAYRAAADKISDDKLYAPLDAVRLAKETSTSKFALAVSLTSEIASAGG